MFGQDEEKTYIRDKKNSNVLSDGFQEVFSFHGHSLTVLGIACIDQDEKIKKDDESHVYETRKYKETQFLSWDSKGVMIWERGGLKIHHKFPPGIIS